MVSIDDIYINHEVTVREARSYSQIGLLSKSIVAGRFSQMSTTMGACVGDIYLIWPVFTCVSYIIARYIHENLRLNIFTLRILSLISIFCFVFPYLGR
jgi:hypothetical protein